jgi:hypothetical protein
MFAVEVGLSLVLAVRLPSHGSPSSSRHNAVSASHTYYRPPLGVFALHSPFLYSPFPSPSYRLAQDIFEPKLFPFKYSSNLIPVILHIVSGSYSPFRVKVSVIELSDAVKGRNS